MRNDARLDYRLTSAGIELAGGNRKRLVYTSRSKDVARSGGGEGPFYKVELQMTSGKPVGYPIAIGFSGCGCDGW